MVVRPDMSMYYFLPSYVGEREALGLKRRFGNRFVACVEKWHKLDDVQKNRWNSKNKKPGLSGYILFVSKCQKNKDM